jgi:hypothetical protein
VGTASTPAARKGRKPDFGLPQDDFLGYAVRRNDKVLSALQYVVIQAVDTVGSSKLLCMVNIPVK